MSDRKVVFRAILFDLDGTLVNSEDAISSSISYAFERSGRDPPSAEELRSWIGPPLAVSLLKFLPPTELEAALADYRNYFATNGVFLCQPYPGIPETLSILRDRGYSCFVTTGKLVRFATMTLQHCNISHYFDDVFAVDNHSSNKKEVVARAVSVLGLEPAHGVVVGDRIDDIEAAHAIGMQCIAVRYGFGSTDELARADAFAATPDDIAALSDTLLHRIP